MVAPGPFIRAHRRARGLPTHRSSARSPRGGVVCCCGFGLLWFA